MADVEVSVDLPESEPAAEPEVIVEHHEVDPGSSTDGVVMATLIEMGQRLERMEARLSDTEEIAVQADLTAESAAVSADEAATEAAESIVIVEQVLEEAEAEEHTATNDEAPERGHWLERKIW